MQSDDEHPSDRGENEEDWWRDADLPADTGVPPPLVASQATRQPSRLAARVGALFEVIACSDFPTQLLIAQLLFFAGMTPVGPDQRYSAAFVVTLSLSDAVLLVGLVFWFLYLHGERPRDVLLGRRAVWREAVLGVVLVPVVFLVAAVVLGLVQAFAPSLHNVARNPLESLIRSRWDALLFALVAVVSGGIREEVQRAFILRRFEQHLGGAPLGLVLFSFVFGTGHLIQGWDAVVTTATLGAFWGLVYLARRSIAAPVVSHAGFDLAEIIRYTLYGP